LLGIPTSICIFWVENWITFNWLGMSSGLPMHILEEQNFQQVVKIVLLSTMCFLKVSKFSNHAFILYRLGHGAHFKE
jgi:hypothetical protein